MSLSQGHVERKEQISVTLSRRKGSLWARSGMELGLFLSSGKPLKSVEQDRVMFTF